MTNAAIELHDSRVVSVRVIGSDVVIDLDAYVHVSDGIPGRDAGTGWARPVRITVRAATLESTIGDTLLIYGGAARIGSATAAPRSASSLTAKRTTSSADGTQIHHRGRALI